MRAAVRVWPTPPAPIATAITGAWLTGWGLESCLDRFFLGDRLAALELEAVERGGVGVDFVPVVRGDHDLLPGRHALPHPAGDIAALGLPGQLPQRVDGHQVLGGASPHGCCHRGAIRVFTEPGRGLACLLGQESQQVGLGLPVAGHHVRVQVCLRDGQYVFTAGRQAERGVVGPADHDAPGAEPVVQLDQVPGAVVAGSPLALASDRQYCHRNFFGPPNSAIRPRMVSCWHSSRGRFKIAVPVRSSTSPSRAMTAAASCSHA